MAPDKYHHIRDKDENNNLELLFDNLFRQHELRLYNLAYRLTKSHQQSCDIIQDVFLKLWEQREIINNLQNAEAWLYRVTENKVIDFLRKTAADKRLQDVLWAHLQQHAEETESVITTKEYNQIILKAINNLPPQRRLIYHLNRDKGMNYNEIAAQLSISRHTVKNQLSTALQSIRRFITKNLGTFLGLF